MEKPFYVYALVDPRDGSPFYIGKGKGRRMSVHTAKVRRNRWDTNGAKCERISDILRAGFEPQETILNDELSELAMMKGYEEWLSTTSHKRLDAAAKVFGGTAECYSTIRGYLLEFAEAE